jgi:diguanylate cyclase (GGDEF)-like protein
VEPAPVDILLMVAGRAVLLMCVLLAVPTAVWPGGPLAADTYLAGLTLIVASVWWGSRRCPGRARRGWTLIAVTASCWLAGDTLQRVLEAGGIPTDVAGPADVFWLASYPLLVAAVIELIRARGLSRAVRREITLDVIVATIAAAVVVWQLVIAPAIAAGDLTLTTVAGVLYPLGDVAVLALALTLVLAPGRRGVSGWLVLGCLVTTLGVDCLVSLQPVILPGLQAARLDALLLVTNALLAAAALHPDRGLLAKPPAASTRVVAMHRWRVVLLGLGLGVVTVGGELPSATTAAGRVVLVAAGLAISAAILARFYGMVRERESAEALLFHQAHHDQLTGLANRSLLLERVGAALLAPEGGQPRDLVLLYFDLDGFKAINDRCGHSAGDEVLQVVSARLSGLTRPGDTVARVGGDEFVVLCLDVPGGSAEGLGRDLRDAVRAPIDLGDAGEVSVGASVGVYAASVRHGSAAVPALDVDALMRAADAAMYRAKQGGGGVRTAQVTGQVTDQVTGQVPVARQAG